MSAEILPRSPSPASGAARWELWLGACVGAAGLASYMFRQGSALDTLITWVLLGGVLGAALVWSLETLLFGLAGKRKGP